MTDITKNLTRQGIIIHNLMQRLTEILKFIKAIATALWLIQVKTFRENEMPKRKSALNADALCAIGNSSRKPISRDSAV